MTQQLLHNALFLALLLNNKRLAAMFLSFAIQMTVDVWHTAYLLACRKHLRLL